MMLRGGDAVGHRIDADHFGAKPRQRLAQHAAAAADVEDAQALQAVEPRRIAGKMRRGAVADIAEPHRIEAVQRRPGAVRIPPLAGEPREMRDRIVVDRAGRWSVSFHLRIYALARLRLKWP